MTLKPPTGPNTPINSGIAEEGTALPWRNQVNFVGDAVTATDDSANNRTDVTISAAALADLDAIPFSTKVANYQTILADAGTVVRMNNAADLDFTLPNDATVDYPLGTVIGVRRVGVGAVNLKKMVGVTIPNKVEPAGAADRTIADQFGEVSFHKVAANTYEAVGDLA